MGDNNDNGPGSFLLVVVPCLNEQNTVGWVVANVPRDIEGIGKVEVLVFDDGSTDETAHRAREAGAEVVSHQTNQGLGATFRDAVGIALSKGADIMVHIAGVDFSAELVARVKEAKPAVNAVVGDVRVLDFEDRSLGAYISLGVVEHFWDGMGGILSEARRVLEDEGVLLLNVPHFSPLFKRRADNESFQPASGRKSTTGQDFYQFYFTKAEIERQLGVFRIGALL